MEEPVYRKTIVTLTDYNSMLSSRGRYSSETTSFATGQQIHPTFAASSSSSLSTLDNVIQQTCYHGTTTTSGGVAVVRGIISSMKIMTSLSGFYFTTIVMEMARPSTISSLFTTNKLFVLYCG